MSISNREEANKYYQLINNLVDNYIDGHKIRPSRLRSYLKPGSARFNKFLERNKLKDIRGAEIILKDIIEDREYMEKDGILQFESFHLFESSEWKIKELRGCLWKGIEKADLNSEKSIADYFDINLGSVDILDSGKHKFKIEDWKNDDWVCVIYSDEDLEVILENLKDYFWEELSNKKVDLGSDIKIDLTQLVKKDSFLEKISKILDLNKIKEIVSKSLGEDWSYEGKIRNYHIWIS